jgi:phosphatidylserine/phosphatidylglycerophosphate/cardiolipin synthase-like enzyme
MTRRFAGPLAAVVPAAAVLATAAVFATALLAAAPAAARVRTYFTSELKDATDGVLIDAFRKASARAKVGRKGQIDVLVFSFTTRALADEILRIADAYPDLVSVRVMLDGSQMSESEAHMGPYLYHAARGEYEDACRSPCEDVECEHACVTGLASALGGRTLANVAVRYWFYDAWVWSETKKMPAFSHSKGVLMHHKAAVVNRQLLATGSYNWSASAAKTNYENVQVFSGTRERRVVDEFLAEFEAIWHDPERSVTTEEGRARKAAIWDALYEAHGVEPR